MYIIWEKEVYCKGIKIYVKKNNTLQKWKNKKLEI